MPDQEREKYLKEISSLHAENATLKEEMALMQSQLDWFKKQMFGRKSEQSTVIFEGGEQISLMPDEKASSDKTTEETITVPEHKRKKKRTFEEAMADLPVEKVIHELEDKTCDKCGAELIQRKDDNLDSLKVRLEEYHKNTQAVIEYYEKADIVKDVNADQSREEVFNEIKAVLEGLC